MKKKTPAGTGAGKSTSETNSTVPGPVQKLQILAERAKDPDLSRTELAVLCVLANGMNSQTGEHWRGFTNWARDTGASLRQVKRGMARLRSKGYVVLVKPGNRKDANIYTLGSVTDDTTSSEVVTPEVIGSDMEGHEVVTPTTPLSSPLSEPIARIERNRSAEGDAMPGGPAVAALGQRQPDKSKPGRDLFPGFWAVYPLRAGVANAEGKLEALIQAGASYEEILAGAKRYAEYCKATKQVRRSPADSWLDRQSWRDEWSAPKAKEDNKPKDQTTSSLGIIPNNAVINTRFNQEMEKYEKDIKKWKLENEAKLKDVNRLDGLVKASEKKLLDHAEECDQCLNSGNFSTYDGKLEEEVLDATKLCETGQSLEKIYRPFIDGLVNLDDELQETRPVKPQEWEW